MARWVQNRFWKDDGSTDFQINATIAATTFEKRLSSQKYHEDADDKVQAERHTCSNSSFLGNLRTLLLNQLANNDRLSWKIVTK